MTPVWAITILWVGIALGFGLSGILQMAKDN